MNSTRYTVTLPSTATHLPQRHTFLTMTAAQAFVRKQQIFCTAKLDVFRWSTKDGEVCAERR